MNRTVRFFDLLDVLDYDYDDEERQKYQTRRCERAVPKECLEEIYKRLEIGYPGGLTSHEIRDEIRSAGFTGKRDKKPETYFSGEELFRLIRSLNHTEFLEAEDIRPEKKPFQAGLRLNINGEERRVLRSWTDEPNGDQKWESYLVARFSDDVRLTLLYDYDAISPTDHSAIVEERRKPEPYHRWTQTEYVQTFEIQ